jgi:hypothetical protein
MDLHLHSTFQLFMAWCLIRNRYGFTYYHDLGMFLIIDGLGLVNEFVDHLYTPLEITLYRSLTHTDYCPQSIIVSTSRFLTTASNSGNSLGFRAQVLLSQQPVQNCRQLTTQLTGSQADGPYTSLVVFSSQADFQLTTEFSLTNQLLHVTSLN